MQQRWGEQLQQDPAYNPNLCLDNPHFRRPGRRDLERWPLPVQESPQILSLGWRPDRLVGIAVNPARDAGPATRTEATFPLVVLSARMELLWLV